MLNQQTVETLEKKKQKQTTTKKQQQQQLLDILSQLFFKLLGNAISDLSVFSPHHPSLHSRVSR